MQIARNKTLYDRISVILTHFMKYISYALKYSFWDDNISNLYSVCDSKNSCSGIYLIYICDVNDIHCISLYMYKYDILELICEKDTNIEHEIKYDMKKMYSIRVQ